MSKRKRDPTFTNSEKSVLLELVKHHFNIIECKKSDTYSLKKKHEQWAKIAEEFNALSGLHPREPTVLKNCWENLKKRAKQENTARNQNFLKTGGGPLQDKKEDPITNKVLELIQTRVSGFVNIYDSDGVTVLATGSEMPQSQENLEECDEVAVHEESEETVHGDPDPLFTKNWSEYTPAMLRERRNAALLPSTDPEIYQLDAQEHITEPSPSTSALSAPVTFVHEQEATSTQPRTERTTRGRTRPLLPSRRRPVVSSQTDSSRGAHSLNAERIETLLQCNNQAAEEHDIRMRILKLQEQKEKEILEQEKLKTRQEKIKLEILELEFKKIKDSI